MKRDDLALAALTLVAGGFAHYVANFPALHRVFLRNEMV